MNLDYKKFFVRSILLGVFGVVGATGICVYSGFEDLTVVKENGGVLFLGIFLGLWAGYMQHVFVEKKEVSK